MNKLLLLLLYAIILINDIISVFVLFVFFSLFIWVHYLGFQRFYNIRSGYIAFVYNCRSGVVTSHREITHCIVSRSALMY